MKKVKTTSSETYQLEDNEKLPRISIESDGFTFVSEHGEVSEISIEAAQSLLEILTKHFAKPGNTDGLSEPALSPVAASEAVAS